MMLAHELLDLIIDGLGFGMSHIDNALEDEDDESDDDEIEEEPLRLGL